MRLEYLQCWAILLVGACGGAESVLTPEPDARECTPIVLSGGGEIPDAPNGAARCPPGTCNYQSQQGCPSTQACRPLFPAGSSEVVAACEPAGSGRGGDACQDPTDCARGYFCVPSESVCRKQCCGGDWSACDAGESCIRQFYVAFGMRREHALDLCYPVGTCDAFDPASCADEPGRECKIVDPTGALACAPISSKGPGDACAPPDVCAQGLTCVGGVCRRLCRTELCAEPGCPPGEGPCVHFNRNPHGVGECTPGF